MATAVGSMNVELLYRRVRVRDASVDTQQRLPYNPNAPRNPFKKLNPKPNNVVPTSTASSPAVAFTAQTVSELLKRKTAVVQGTPQFRICFSLINQVPQAYYLSYMCKKWRAFVSHGVAVNG